MSAIDDFRTRLVAIDPQITSYMPSALDTLSGLRVAAHKARQWAAGEGGDVAAIDKLIADLEAPTSAETTPAVTITPVAEATELYRHEQGQPTQQEVRMHLDIESGTLSAAYTPRGDEESMPKSVYDRRGVLWAIPCLTMDAANRLMAEAAPLAQRIIDGTEIYWDGQSRVGTQNADATSAIAAVVELIRSYDDVDHTISEYSGDEYYDDGPDAARETLGINADTTDAELARIVEAAAAEALDNGVVIPDLHDYLTQLRDELREAERDELADVAAALTRLTRRRDELIRRQLVWGDSSRAVGTRAGMSHVNAQKIGRSRETVTFDSPEMASFVADLIRPYGVTQPKLDGSSLTISNDALEILGEIGPESDGHYDGTSVWVGGTGYAVSRQRD